MQTVHLTVHRGDDDHFLLTIRQDGKEMDLTGADVAMSIQPTGKPIIHLPPESISLLSGGKIALRFDHHLTQQFKFRTARFDVRARQNGLVDTLVSGTIQVQDTITPMPGQSKGDFNPEKNILVDVEPTKVISIPDNDTTDYLALLTLAMQP